jgi:hypothetical protein
MLLLVLLVALITGEIRVVQLLLLNPQLLLHRHDVDSHLIHVIHKVALMCIFIVVPLLNTFFYALITCSYKYCKCYIICGCSGLRIQHWSHVPLV